MAETIQDRTSGSTDVARSALDALERWAAIDTSIASKAFRTALLEQLRAMQGSQPSMALVHQIAARALEVVDSGIARGDAPADLRAHLAASCAAERNDLAAARAGAARMAVALVGEPDAWVATLSQSGTVRDALLEAHRTGLRPHVLVGEGRPLLEGRALAAALGAAGLPTWLVVDAALPLLLSQSAMVWIGADAVTDHGVLNKVGSYAVALAAREHAVPVYALAQRKKFIPASTPALRIAERPPQEVWREPSPGVRPRNVQFELVPMRLLRGVVVEDAVLAPGEAATVARERPIPDELANG